MEQIFQHPNTSSLQDVTIPNLHTAVGDDRLLAVMYKKLEELDKEVHELKTKKIIDETQMPPELLEQAGMLPPDPKKLRRGRGARPLLRTEIEEAIKHSKFCTDQARYLGVGVRTYKKYAEPLGLYHPQPHHKGAKKPWGPEKGRHPLSKILLGDFYGDTAITDWKVKRKMLKAGWPEECAVCGYNKRHLTTGHVPLLLDHIDGDRKNFKKENLRLLCWNDMIDCGRGYLHKEICRFDPNWGMDAK
jgi:hypothetical protein